MDQIVFIEPNFKDLLVWARYLMFNLDRTKCLVTPVLECITYSCYLEKRKKTHICIS